MSDEVKRNLEPIDDIDLNLEKKFGGASGGLAEKPFGETEKEAPIAKEISSAEKDNAYSQILSKVQNSDQDGITKEGVSADAEMVHDAQMDAQGHVQKLVALAMDKGVVHAVKVAKHLEDNYVLDMFHDQLLSEEFHSALIAKGLIK